MSKWIMPNPGDSGKTIWGICGLGHDGSLSVVRDGEILFAGHTERYTRIKNDPNLCNEIVNEALEHGEPDRVIWHERPWLKKRRQMVAGQWNEVFQTSNLPSQYMKQFQHMAPHKLEYVDYFNSFLECKNPPPLKYLFIDEAQDLSAHQWMVVDMIQEISKPLETYVAGDDDQAIFRWAGADIEHFIKMAKSELNYVIPLTQSYRVPKSVHTLATKMAQSISNRIDKQYNPRDDEGERKVLNFRPLNKELETGEWLILCRTHEIVKQVCESLDRYGWLYKCYGKSVVNEKIIEAIVSWTRLQKGHEVSGARVDTIYSFMDSTRIKRGHGTFKGSHTEMYTIDNCIHLCV